jgi:hypothetical protein
MKTSSHIFSGVLPYGFGGLFFFLQTLTCRNPTEEWNVRKIMPLTIAYKPFFKHSIQDWYEKFGSMC